MIDKNKLTWAIGPSSLNRNEALLLRFLLLCADDNGKCFPSVGTITEQTKMCETSYKKAINSLIGMGLVRRQFRFSKENGQQRSNYFFLSAFLFSGTKEAITNFINRARKAWLEKENSRQKEMELPLTACSAHEDISLCNSVQNRQNQRENMKTRINNHLTNTYRNIRKLLAKTKNRYIAFTAPRDNHVKIHFGLFKKLFYFRNNMHSERQTSFHTIDGGSRDNFINYSFYSLKKKKYITSKDV